MDTKALARQQDTGGLIEQVLLQGDLARLSPEQRVSYYSKVCETVGLNPYTKPFEYLSLNNKLVLYARKDATDQLRKLHGVSIVIASREVTNDLCVVAARASLPDGRTDEAIGAVSTMGLKGDALANAYMKAETKAKRRVTLSICGLGVLDETEVETIRDARAVRVDVQTGEIHDTTARELPLTHGPGEPPPTVDQPHTTVTTRVLPSDPLAGQAAKNPQEDRQPPKTEDGPDRSQMRPKQRQAWAVFEAATKGGLDAPSPLLNGTDEQYEHYVTEWRGAMAQQTANGRR